MTPTPAPDAESGTRALPRCLTLAAVLPFLALGACASGGAARGSGFHDAPSAGPSPSVRDSDVKTLENLFAGRFAGVTVTRAGAGGIQIRIRGGNNSFLGSSEPLYVVDGTPIPPGTGGLLYVNPYDIEAIEVLKNPADIALYGVRGGNGVVRVTTKRPPGTTR